MPAAQDRAGAGFVDKIVTDPANIPDVMRLYGYPGASSEAGHTRLYLDPDLSAYVEIPEAAILHRATIPESQDPLRGEMLWVRKDAALKQKASPAANNLAQYFAGVLAGAHGAVAPPVGAGPFQPPNAPGAPGLNTLAQCPTQPVLCQPSIHILCPPETAPVLCPPQTLPVACQPSIHVLCPPPTLPAQCGQSPVIACPPQTLACPPQTVPVACLPSVHVLCPPQTVFVQCGHSPVIACPPQTLPVACLPSVHVACPPQTLFVQCNPSPAFVCGHPTTPACPFPSIGACPSIACTPFGGGGFGG